MASILPLKRRLDEQFAPLEEHPFFPQWIAALRALEARFAALEAAAPALNLAITNLQNAGLSRINEFLAPAIERVVALAEVGFLVASSGSAVTLTQGADKIFVVDAGNQRELFTPSQWVSIAHKDNWQNRAVGFVHSYDNATGELHVTLTYVHLANNDLPGPFAGWTISGGIAIDEAINEKLELTEAARATAVAAAADAATLVSAFGDPDEFIATVNQAVADAQAAAAAASTFNPANFMPRSELATTYATIASLAGYVANSKITDGTLNPVFATMRANTVVALANGANIDNHTWVGFFEVSNPAGSVPAAGRTWFLECLSSPTAGWRLQRLTDRDNPVATYERILRNGVWGAWRTRYDSGNLPAFLAAADVATASQFRNNTADKVLDTDAVWSAATPVAIPYAATMALDFSGFINATIAQTGNITLTQPTGLIPGKEGTIELAHAAGVTVSASTTWFYLVGGMIELSTDARTEVLAYKHLANGKVLLSLAKDS